MNKEVKSPVIVALDFDSEKQCLEFVDAISPSQCRLKVGKEMFTHFGPEFVKQLMSREFDVFLDLKFHDIPNTVAGACQAAADMGVWMVNVHASGGEAMMQAAKNALDAYGDGKPLLIAVTVLTSLNDDTLKAQGNPLSVNDYAFRLANLAKDSGLDGVVCSALEAKRLRALGDDFKLVTPGIRLKDSVSDDQVRIMTPIDAIKAGSDYLVIGRPITQAPNPEAVLKSINSSLVTQ